MLDTKKHVLELRNSMVASDKSFDRNQNRTLKPKKTLKLANLANFGPRAECQVGLENLGIGPLLRKISDFFKKGQKAWKTQGNLFSGKIFSIFSIFTDNFKMLKINC